MRLILNDGTIIENGRAGYAQGFLWCYFSGHTMPQMAALFFDASKTARITFQFGDMSANYDGFTDCVNLNVDVDGNCAVCLAKGAVD